MTGLADLLRSSGLTQRPDPPPQVMAATVLDVDPLRVQVPDLDGGKHALRAFGSRAGMQSGDEVRVEVDAGGIPVVVAWEGEEATGGGAPSGPAGGVLSGDYPDPGFAADMATQAELDAHKASSDHDGRYYTEAEVDLALAGKQPLDADLTAIAALSTTSFGRAFLTLADAASARTAMALVIGADVQAYDADLAAIAALSTTAFGRSFLTQADAAAARTLLSLTPGTDVQAFDSDLAAIAALTTTAYGRSLLTQADAAAARSTLGLVIGTDVQAQDAQLAAIAGLTPANDQVIYWTGATSAAMTALTSTARSLLDDTSIGAMRTTLDVPSNAEAILDAIGDAKGDLIGFSAADTPVRVAVGSADQVPTPDAAQTAGWKWARPRAVGAFSVYRNAAVSYVNNSEVVFDTEDYDLDSWHATATGRYTPQVAGYYVFEAELCVTAGQLADQQFLSVQLMKNGTVVKVIGYILVSGTTQAVVAAGASPPVLANGSTDFFSIRIAHNKGAAASLVVGSSTHNWFGGRFVGTA